MMNFFVCFLLSVLAFSAFADEREVLLNRLNGQYDTVLKTFQNCDGPQVELTAAAGNLWNVTEPLLPEAAEWRLRQSTTSEERKKIIRNLYLFGKEIDAIFSASREGTGSDESLQRCIRASGVVMRQVQIFLLPDDRYAAWGKMADAEIRLDGKTIRLRNGIGSFAANPYDDEVELQVRIDPESCFVHAGQEYVIVTVDLPDACNSNYLTQYLCRFQSGIFYMEKKLGSFFLKKIEQKNGKITIFGQKTHQNKPYILSEDQIFK